MGHQGNDFQITGAFWRELNALSREFDEPGRFVCIPGYEWSANTAVGGDRNVHYRHEGETIHRSSHAQIADAADIVDEGADAHDARRPVREARGQGLRGDGPRRRPLCRHQVRPRPPRDRGRGALRLGHLRVDRARRLREGLSRRHRRQLRRPQGPAGRLLSRRLVLRQLRRAHLLPGRAPRSRRHLRVHAPAPSLRHHRQPRASRCRRGRWPSHAEVFLRDPAVGPTRVGRPAAAADGRHRPRRR